MKMKAPSKAAAKMRTMTAIDAHMVKPVILLLRTQYTTPRPLRDFCSIEVERNVVAAFRKEAIARQTSVPRLIRALLDVIAYERLTGAILDE
jgi:hypothetical protein